MRNESPPGREPCVVFALALVACVSFTSPFADAATIELDFDGVIVDTETGSTVDWLQFTVDHYADVTVDVLAYEYDSYNDVDVDLVGTPGTYTYLDSVIYLFEGIDPSIGGALLADSDDWFFPDGNGSVDELDSYISSVLLAPGTYTLAIGEYYLGESDARAHENVNSYTFLGFADYHVDVTIIERPVEDDPTSPIPEPATISLLGLGLAGVVHRRRTSD